jgi:hypothetical protein
MGSLTQPRPGDLTFGFGGGKCFSGPPLGRRGPGKPLFLGSGWTQRTGGFKAESLNDALGIGDHHPLAIVEQDWDRGETGVIRGFPGKKRCRGATMGARC